MAFTFRNGEHHRNPSGCHNKVKWFLSECKWNIEALKNFTNDFLVNELYDRNSPNPNHKGNRDINWFYGWLDAMNIALYIIDNNKSHLPTYVFEKYHWLKKYEHTGEAK